MKLYIANLTKQNYIFHFRVPDMHGLKQQSIGIFQQQQIMGDHLTQAQIDNIIEQTQKYNMVKDDEVDRAEGLVSLCYAVGRQINLNKIKSLIEHNQAVLKDRGVEFQKQAAIEAYQVSSRPDPSVQDFTFNPSLKVDIVENETTGGAATEVETHIDVRRPERPGNPATLTRAQRKAARARS